MTMLRDLLSTWETWSARETLTRALGNIADADGRDRITKGLAEMPWVSALDALRDNTELVELLTGWQWQAMYAARREGASWEQIGIAMGTTPDVVRAGYVAVLDRQELVLGRDVPDHRRVL